MAMYPGSVKNGAKADPVTQIAVPYNKSRFRFVLSPKNPHGMAVDAVVHIKMEFAMPISRSVAFKAGLMAQKMLGAMSRTALSMEASSMNTVIVNSTESRRGLFRGMARGTEWWEG